MPDYSGISRACGYGNHDDCEWSWCACPHHENDEPKRDVFAEFDDYLANPKPLKALWEVESERKEST